LVRIVEGLIELVGDVEATVGDAVNGYNISILAKGLASK
jgi:hypothetical protein